MTIKTLTGYLGRDPELRDTRTRTYEKRTWNRVAEGWDYREVQTTSREYVRMSLATHRHVDGKWTTTWHQLTLWRPWEMAFRQWIHAKKGSKVTVTGYYDSFSFRGKDGEPVTITRFIVQSFDLWPDKKTRPEHLKKRSRASRPAPEPTTPPQAPPPPVARPTRYRFYQ